MSLRGAALAAAALLFSASAFAHSAPRAYDPAKDVGFDQHLGATLPLTARFRDELGRPVELGTFVGRRPIILVMSYFDCPNLCTIVLNGLLSTLRKIDFDAGNQFEVLAVSISPTESPSLARQKKSAYLAGYPRPGADQGWHFLTGQKPAIDALAQSVGFRYFYDAQDHQYAHPAGLVVITTDGRVTKYLPGVAFPVQEVRLALVEASTGHIGTLTDRLWLLCYHFDPATGRYTLLVERIVRAAAFLVVLALGGLIGFLVLRERGRKRQAAAR